MEEYGPEDEEFNSEEEEERFVDEYKEPSHVGTLY